MLVVYLPPIVSSLYIFHPGFFLRKHKVMFLSLSVDIYIRLPLTFSGLSIQNHSYPQPLTPTLQYLPSPHTCMSGVCLAVFLPAFLSDLCQMGVRARI